MRTLLKDLSEYSRLGRHSRPSTPTDLNEMLSEVEADLTTSIAEAGAKIQSDVLPIVMCDKTQMAQVFQNLLSNAVKYRDPDRPPLITITASIAATATKNHPGLPILELVVSDNGIGFDNQYSDRLFEPFYRLHPTDKYAGSGIGLAICRKVIERHGGTITASGRSGQGAEFTIRLPPPPLDEGQAARS